MTSYVVEMVPGDKLNDTLIEHCPDYLHDDVTVCAKEIKQAFMFTYRPRSHVFDAWDDDEAARIAACWITTEGGDSALGCVRPARTSDFVYLHGTEVVR